METTIPEKKSSFATEPIGKLIVRFAIPGVIALLVNSLYNIVDQIFIGWGVGYLGNGATNIVFPITIIALALSMMIGNGGAAYLSLKLGEGEAKAAQKGVGNAITLSVVVSIILAIVFIIFIDPLLTLFGATEILRPYALDYGYIIGAGLPFMMISAAINSMIRADGSPKYAMFSMVIGAILNAILDPVLIFVFHIGHAGSRHCNRHRPGGIFCGVCRLFAPFQNHTAQRFCLSSEHTNLRKYCDIRFEQLYYPVCHHNRHGANQ